MTWLQALVIYVALTPLAFFVFYTNSIDWNMRLTYKPKSKFYLRALQLLMHDYFEVHCPWSWERAKQHRLNDMRVFLGEHGSTHELLGHLVAADCDNPLRQELIARKTYVSRLKFWSQGLLNLVTALPKLVLLVAIIVIGTPIALCLDGWNKLSGN